MVSGRAEQVGDGPSYDDFTVRRMRGDAGGDVDGEASDIAVLATVDLAGMDPGRACRCLMLVRRCKVRRRREPRRLAVGTQ